MNASAALFVAAQQRHIAVARYTHQSKATREQLSLVVVVVVVILLGSWLLVIGCWLLLLLWLFLSLAFTSFVRRRWDPTSVTDSEKRGTPTPTTLDDQQLLIIEG